MSRSATPHFEVQDAKVAWAAPFTDNERAWVEIIRLMSGDTDPPPTLEMVQQVRLLLFEA